MPDQPPQVEALGQMLMEEVSRHADTRTRFIAAINQLHAMTARAEAAEKKLAAIETPETNVIDLRPDIETA